MSARDVSSGFVNLILTAAKNLGENRKRQRSRWKRDNVESRQRLAAHCVYIRERVGSSDLSEVVRVVDNGREEIDRLNERNVVRQQIDARIDECLTPYEEARILRRWKPRENFRQVPRTHFRSSTGAPRERCQSKKLLSRLGRAHCGLRGVRRHHG